MTPEKKIENMEPVTEPDMGHDYDGIRELDNKLPFWWQAIFYLTIIFSFGYWAYYHVLEAGPLQMERYEIEMAQAEAAAEARSAGKEALSDELLLAYSQDTAKVSAGQADYAAYCAACHGANGEGGIGPNLTDAYWIHGASPMEIHKVISEGVATAGMPSWKGVLGDSKVEQVAAYILTLKGKNLPGKEPQGEKVEE